MTDKIVVFCTCANTEEAAKIARLLVEKRLAACVNILPQIRSIYRWQGAIEDSTEVLLLVKSKRELFEQLRNEIAAAHSYEVPEVIALPIVDGAESYLQWMDRQTGAG
jgi:periplasmic divalent cation tolerance protein